MKKLFVIAALLMAASAANAGNGVSFQVQGHKIRIEAPRNCESLSCLQISAPSLSGSNIDLKGLKSKRSGGNNDVAVNSDTPVEKSTAAAVDQAPAPLPPIPSVRDPEPITSTTASVAPAVRDDIASSAPSTTSAAPAPVAAAPSAPATTPLGIWATEDGKGNVRVEQCGANLCGSSANNANEKILINMKPSDNKWTGQIHDPDSGRTYASTITMKGPNAMRVQGCAFGGMFCGGQTWKRIS
jgi:uncharacterized protein (DUF2147 family)